MILSFDRDGIGSRHMGHSKECARVRSSPSSASASARDRAQLRQSVWPHGVESGVRVELNTDIQMGHSVARKLAPKLPLLRKLSNAISGEEK